MDQLLPPLIVSGVLTLIVWLAVSAIKTSRRRVCRWADENQYTIVTMQLRLFRRGPFFLKSTGNQVVYRVLVQDAGEEREAFVKIGGAFVGLLRDRFEVRWVESDS